MPCRIYLAKQMMRKDMFQAAVFDGLPICQVSKLVMGYRSIVENRDYACSSGLMILNQKGPNGGLSCKILLKK